ncbi:hypothetical protein [Streptomyces sp. NPDC006879]|uniref:hypothetical protein n=1 Tax=Streptomyces sp. NPDC006879 TaxID=3364767 RepID=UPI003699094D
MSASGLWRKTRAADGRVALVLGVGNVLLVTVLLEVSIGGLWLFEAVTREQENSARELAGTVFGCWLAGGLLVFSVLGMTRTLFSHLVTMLLPPALLIMVAVFSW